MLGRWLPSWRARRLILQAGGQRFRARSHHAAHALCASSPNPWGRARFTGFQRVYEWYLGSPTDRIPPGADEGALGMREGGWRRLVIPAALAYGEAGLLKPGGNDNKAIYVVPPNAPVYFDLRMIDGGSGKCEEILHGPGISDKASQRLKSITCLRGVP